MQNVAEVVQVGESESRLALKVEKAYLAFVEDARTGLVTPLLCLRVAIGD